MHIEAMKTRQIVIGRLLPIGLLVLAGTFAFSRGDRSRRRSKPAPWAPGHRWAQ